MAPQESVISVIPGLKSIQKEPHCDASACVCPVVGEVQTCVYIYNSFFNLFEASIIHYGGHGTGENSTQQHISRPCVSVALSVFPQSHKGCQFPVSQPLYPVIGHMYAQMKPTEGHV